MTTRTVKFLKTDYVVEGTVDAPEGAIFLDTLASAQLVELCNLLISNLDLGNRIKMFQNKGKGVKRVTDLLLKYDAAFDEAVEAEEAEFNDDLPPEMQPALGDGLVAKSPPTPLDVFGLAESLAHDVAKPSLGELKDEAEVSVGDVDDQAAKKQESLVSTAAVPQGKVRDGSKQAALVDLLKRSEGASIKEIAEALNWLPHTTRGAISRDVKKRLGYTVTTSKVEGRGRVYRIEA